MASQLPVRRSAPARPSNRPPPRAPRAGTRALDWVVGHKALVLGLGFAVVAATFAAAALLIRQDVTANPSASNAVIKFQNGSDYAAINVAGFATLTIPASGSSATMAFTGVSGAALTSLGNVLAINNTASSQNYTMTLTRSAVPNAAIQGLNITIKDGASTLETWNVLTAASSNPFTHVAGRVLNMTVEVNIADGTAAGALGSFGIQFAIAPV